MKKILLFPSLIHPDFIDVLVYNITSSGIFIKSLKVGKPDENYFCFFLKINDKQLSVCYKMKTKYVLYGLFRVEDGGVLKKISIIDHVQEEDFRKILMSIIFYLNQD
jgi:hypothetical protein